MDIQHKINELIQLDDELLKMCDELDQKNLPMPDFILHADTDIGLNDRLFHEFYEMSSTDAQEFLKLYLESPHKGVFELVFYQLVGTPLEEWIDRELESSKEYREEFLWYFDSQLQSFYQEDMENIDYNVTNHENGLICVEIEPSRQMDDDSPEYYEMIVDKNQTEPISFWKVYENDNAETHPSLIPYYIVDKFCEIAKNDLGMNFDSLKENRCNLDILKQYETETNYGEPQYWIYLESGRSIEVTLEQEGLEEKDWFYCIRYHCSAEEYQNQDFRNTDGIIDVINEEKNSTNYNAMDDVLRDVDFILQHNDEIMITGTSVDEIADWIKHYNFSNFKQKEEDKTMNKRLEKKFQMAVNKIYSSEWYDKDGERMLLRDEIELDLIQQAEKEIGSNSQSNVTAKAYDIALQRLEDLDWFSTKDEKLMTKEKWDALFEHKIKYYEPHWHNVWTESDFKYIFEKSRSIKGKYNTADFDQWLDNEIQSKDFILFDDYLAKHWDSITMIMDDDHREAVYRDLVPCSREEFLTEYINRYSDMDEVLNSEFEIDVDDFREVRKEEKENGKEIGF